MLGFIASVALGDLAFLDGRLTLDALVAVNARWQRTERLGLATSRVDFYRYGAPVGMTGAISDAASLRLGFDVGINRGPSDLYIDLHRPSGWRLRAGQFVPPVGLEALTRPADLKFVENSIVKTNWRPWSSRDIDIWDPRDIGVMAAFGSSFIEAAGAVINGSGKNAWLSDDNGWKDICGRVAVRPLRGDRFLVALRGYYGRTGAEGTEFWNLAVEFGANWGGLHLAGEGQHAAAGASRRTTGYVQGTFDAHALLEPVIRADASFKANETEIIVTPGINLRIAADHLVLMLDYVYRRRQAAEYSQRLTEQKILVQLQAWL